MAEQTSNYNLIKPSENDVADINIINSNFDTIDAKIKENNDNISNTTNEIKTTITEIANEVSNNTNAIDIKENILNTDQKRKITFSTADPTYGSNGDIWIKYEA